MIEKFPELGTPLILFGGLVTIPFWGLRSVSIAMTDVMLADLPHVLYNAKDKITDEDIKKADELQKKLREKQQSGVSLLGKRSFDNAVNVDNFVNSKLKR